MHIHTHTHTHTHTHIYIYTHTLTHTHTHIYIYIYIFVCVCVSFPTSKISVFFDDSIIPTNDSIWETFFFYFFSFNHPLIAEQALFTSPSRPFTPIFPPRPASPVTTSPNYCPTTFQWPLAKRSGFVNNSHFHVSVFFDSPTLTDDIQPINKKTLNKMNNYIFKKSKKIQQPWLPTKICPLLLNCPSLTNPVKHGKKERKKERKNHAAYKARILGFMRRCFLDPKGVYWEN